MEPYLYRYSMVPSPTEGTTRQTRTPSLKSLTPSRRAARCFYPDDMKQLRPPSEKSGQVWPHKTRNSLFVIDLCGVTPPTRDPLLTGQKPIRAKIQTCHPPKHHRIAAKLCPRFIVKLTVRNPETNSFDANLGNTGFPQSQNGWVCGILNSTKDNYHVPPT